METYTVAVCQINCGPNSQPPANALKITACLRQAAAAGAKLALFPELSLSGYSTDEQDILAKAQATTPPLLASVCQAAQDLDIATVVGLYEAALAPGKVYNASVAVAPDGTRTVYRKIHICPNEPFWPSDGGLVVADLGFLRLALSVCYDIWYPETTRMAFLNGAQMLHVPFYWPAEWERQDDLPRKQVTGDDAAVLAARGERMLKVFPGRAPDNALYWCWWIMPGEAAILTSTCMASDLSLIFPGLSEIRTDSPCFAALLKVDLRAMAHYVFLLGFRTQRKPC